jgi:hypothetical protein
VAEPRYLSACTRATTVFAILTVFFAVKPGLAFSVQRRKIDRYRLAWRR